MRAGTMKALAGARPRHVVGICGLVENMPDGNAQRPGDIVTSMSGQTIERNHNLRRRSSCLVRRTALGAGTRYPDTIIDLAMLTGAIIISRARTCWVVFEQ